MASLIENVGAEDAKKWAEGIVANMARPPKGNDRDQMKAVVAGIGDVAIVNTYYLGKLLASDDVDEQEVGKKIGIFFPNQEGRGAHINISGAGITAHSKNKENAIKLLEFLTDNEAQKVFAESNFEYPVKLDVEPSDLLKSWGTFKADTINFNQLGALNTEAVKIFDEVGWK